MSIKFNDLGSSANLAVNGNVILLSENDVQRAWWDLADLYDHDHSGPALINLGTIPVSLKEDQWKSLYTHTDTFLDKFFWSAILENEIMVH